MCAQVQQQHVEIQRVSVLSAEARRARGGAPAAGARFAPPALRHGAPADERSGAPGCAGSNPTLCYAICAFKQLAELMAKFDQFNEEAKVRAAHAAAAPRSACCLSGLARAPPPQPHRPSARFRRIRPQESEVDRTESRFLPMKVLRDELPDERLYDGAPDDW